MNKPQFKINGKKRRELKKELSGLRAFVKDFWYYHQLDKDMGSFYGKTKNYPMCDKKAQIMFDDSNKKIDELEHKLSIPYTE